MTDSANIDAVHQRKPSVARVYDYMLGGKDNFAADREFAKRFLQLDPDVATCAKLNKQFGRRVVDFMARQGIRQFLDLGSGIPTSPPSVHETARRVREDCAVVYVDNDPVVATHNRALRATGPGLAAVEADLFDLDAIFRHEKFSSTIDSSQPVGVLLLSVVQNTPREGVLQLLADLRSRMAPGSFLAISHLSLRTAQHVQDSLANETAAGRYPRTFFRSDEEIGEFFAGFDLIDPGIVDYQEWRPDGAERTLVSAHFASAVGTLVA